MEMSAVDQMRLFFEPRSLAILGVSRKTGAGSFNILEILQNYGFQGKIFPINPNAQEILGLRCFPTVGTVPENIDLAIISLDRDRVLSAVEACLKVGIKAIIIISQGFADVGGEGKLLQDRIRGMAREKGARIVGPNTIGLVNNFHNFNTSFLPFDKAFSPLSIICQSGIFVVGFPNITGSFGKAIDLGNTCDVDFSDALEYYADDHQTKIIALHIEGLNDGSKFIQTVRKISLKKPILAIKTGRTEIGAQKAASHSGSMAGKDFLYDAAFKQSGIIRVNDIEELNDLAKGFARLPLPKGDRIGILTYSGGGGILAIDKAIELHLQLAKLSPATKQKLSSLIPPWFSLGNPLDIWPSAMQHGLQPMFKTYLWALLEDEGVDAVLSIFLSPELPNQECLDVSDILIEAAEKFPNKPIVAWPYGKNLNELIRKFESAGKVMALSSPDRAINLLSALYERCRFLQKRGVP
jgi:acetate---CoA ligase (ADP-forming)